MLSEVWRQTAALLEPGRTAGRPSCVQRQGVSARDAGARLYRRVTPCSTLPCRAADLLDLWLCTPRMAAERLGRSSAAVVAVAVCLLAAAAAACPPTSLPPGTHHMSFMHDGLNRFVLGGRAPHGVSVTAADTQCPIPWCSSSGPSWSTCRSATRTCRRRCSSCSTATRTRRSGSSARRTSRRCALELEISGRVPLGVSPPPASGATKANVTGFGGGRLCRCAAQRLLPLVERGRLLWPGRRGEH